MFSEKLTKKSEPLYLRARNIVVEKIKNGELNPGDKLPNDKELAKLFGISHITLAKALNSLRREGYLERYRKKGTFVKRREDAGHLTFGADGKLIGLVFDNVSVGTFQTELFVSIQHALERSGFALKFLSSKGDPQIQFEQLKTLIYKGNVGGCIVWSIMDQEQTQEILDMRSPNFPVVFLDRCIDELEMDYSGYEDFNAGKILAKHLIEQGYQKIILPVERSLLPLSTSQQRIAGAREVFLASSCDPENFIVQEIESDIETGNIEEFAIGPEPTALLGVTDRTAVYLLQLAKKAGMNIPKDVAIASFDTQNWLARPEYDITAVRLPADKMGEQAVEILAERLGGDARSVIHLKSKGKLIVRSSTDPKKKKSFPREISYSMGSGLLNRVC